MSFKQRNFRFNYIDGDHLSCDGCDKIKVCASISDIIGNVHIVCKDCLEAIVKKFNVLERG